MTTTTHFQVKPDWFPDSKACLESERKVINSNPRYKFFNQTHFTAGDFQQFQEYRDQTNGSFAIERPPLGDNLFVDIPNLIWQGYKDLDALSVDNTFNYLFEKFKKAIFLKIKHGKLSVFLPFSKKNYTNEWSDRIAIDPKYMDLFSFIKEVQTLSGYKFNPKNVNKFIDTWYSNNCLVRHEYPIYEGDTNVSNFSDMFLTLCQERKVPDLEFFLNRRDFPLLKTDGTEPYEDMFDSDSFPLLSHRYDKYCPIFSMVGRKGFADIPIPTGDDWAMVCRKDGKFFSKTGERDFKMKGTTTIVGWRKRRNTAVFRGSATGRGITVDTNQRLKLAQLSIDTPPDNDGVPLLDAGITDWNARPRKLKRQKYLQVINPNSFQFKLVPRLSPQEQTEYKYIVNVDGHVASYRLSLELGSGSCILLAESDYKLWYRDMLQPFVHYVPVKKDLSDLIQKIKWCKKNDSKCLEIAKNAKKFANTYITKKGILDYLENLLWDVKKTVGNYMYPEVSILSLQEEEERKILEDLVETEGTVYELPFLERSYELYQAVSRFMLPPLNTGTDILPDPPVFKNKNTEITKHSFLGIETVQKKSKNLVHEIFVGKVGTNQLLFQIPNFAYVFGGTHTLSVSEHIKGQTFGEYIKSKDFTMENYILILIQLALGLHVAQRICNFVHNDLTPWNIIIQKCEEKTVEYVIDEKNVYKVKTTLIPVVVDFGRAHIVYKNKHYGTVNPYTFSSIHDVANILITSIYDVASFNLTKEQTAQIITLSNFLYESGYDKHRFVKAGRDGLGDVRFFFGKAKKFSELISKKGEKDSTPLEFVSYVLENLGCDKVSTVGSLVPRKCWSVEQITDYILADTPKGKKDSFVKALKSLKGLGVYDYDIFQSMVPYLKKYKIPYVKKRTDLEKNKPEIEYEFEEEKIPRVEYDDTVFLLPGKVLELLKTTSEVKISDVPSVENLYYLCLRYNAKIDTSFPTPEYTVSLASVKTLREISGILAVKNLEIVKKNRLTNLVKLYQECLHLSK